MALLKAIVRATDQADRWAKGGRIIGDDERIIPRWFMHQLRHKRGTEVREQFGLDAAQVTLGHRHASVTEIYAEQNSKAARQVAAAIG